MFLTLKRGLVSLLVLRRGGHCTIIPVIRTCINMLICLIHSGLISKRKKMKAKKEKGKSNARRMFPCHQDPKSGHNLCCHKFTPIISPFVLLILLFSCFPSNTCSQSLHFCLVGLCLAVLLSLICPSNTAGGH